MRLIIYGLIVCGYKYRSELAQVVRDIKEASSQGGLKYSAPTATFQDSLIYSLHTYRSTDMGDGLFEQK